jgi:hypothetical protein
VVTSFLAEGRESSATIGFDERLHDHRSARHHGNVEVRTDGPS